MEQVGVMCWMAPRDVMPGASYAGQIIHAIDAAKAMVLILSQSAASSPHVLREVERAASKRHPIVSLRIDRVPLPADFEYFLNTSQWLDASAGDTGRVMPKLIAAVRLAIQSPAPALPATGIPGATVSSASPRSASRTSILLASVIGLAILGFAVDRIWRSTRQTIPTPAQTNFVATQPKVTEAIFSPPAHSIAVLPFVNMSGDSKQDYFSDGISEELLNALARLNQLQVTARTSSFGFKGQNVDVSTIAHKLNVGAVLEGSVRRSGNTVRITAQLIDAETGFHMWSQTYDRQMTDILKVQTEVAMAVAQQLAVKLMAAEADKIEIGGTTNPMAYDQYLQGKQIRSREEGSADLQGALERFDRAIALDPNYAAAYAERAHVLLSIALRANNQDITRQTQEKGVASAQRAVALAPEFGDAHAALARTLSHRLDFVGAAREFDLALAIAPGSAAVQRNYAEFAGFMAHSAPALAAARRAVILDPQNFRSHSTLFRVLYEARRFDEARDPLQDALALNPRSNMLAGFEVNLLLATGRYPEASKRCEYALPNEEDRHYFLAIAYHALGRREDAEIELRKLRALEGDNFAYGYAAIQAQWGDRSAALEWLNKAERLHDVDLLALKVDWKLDPIRNEPQFKAIETRLNFPP